RGVYCGAVGWIDTEQDAGDLNVAIRTFTIPRGCAQLGVGAGIVADSQPASEWAETELKAARLLDAAGAAHAAARETALAGGARRGPRGRGPAGSARLPGRRAPPPGRPALPRGRARLATLRAGLAGS